MTTEIRNFITNGIVSDAVRTWANHPPTRHDPDIGAIHDSAVVMRSTLEAAFEPLSQDIINLVIAAREFWDIHNDLSEESKSLDHALEAFSALVPYEGDAS